MKQDKPRSFIQGSILSIGLSLILPISYAQARKTVELPVAVLPNIGTSSNPHWTNADTLPNIGKQRYRLNIAQELVTLKRQVAHYQKMGLSDKIEQLQTQVQSLTGELAVYKHRVEELLSAQSDHTKRLKLKRPAGLSQKSHDNSERAHQAYRRAFELVKHQKYDMATVELQHFLIHYPKSAYATHAHYWLGEMYLLKQEHHKAQQAFEWVAKHDKNSKKRPQALLKLGIIEVKAGHLKQAQQQFQTLIQQFPHHPAAALAKVQLTNLSGVA